MIYCPTSIKVTSLCVHHLLVPCQTHAPMAVGTVTACIVRYSCMYAFKSWNMVLSPRLLLLLTCMILDVLHSHWINVSLPYTTSFMLQAQDHVTHASMPIMLKLVLFSGPHQALCWSTCAYTPHSFTSKLFAVDLLHHYQITKKRTTHQPFPVITSLPQFDPFSCEPCDQALTWGYIHAQSKDFLGQFVTLALVASLYI